MNNRLNIAVVPIYPYVTELENTDDGVVAEGIAPDIIKLLARSLNLTYEFHGNKLSTFGSPDKNGTWSGQVGLIRQKVLDLICPYTKDPYWTTGVKTSKTVAMTGMNIFGAVGRLDNSNFAGFISSFDKDIWYYYFALVFVSILTCAFSDSWAKVRNFSTSPVSKEINNYFWMFLSASFSEGSIKNPASRRSQFLFGMWLVGILTLTNGFFGQFKAILTSRTEEQRIDSVNDLADRPDLIPFIPAETIVSSIFENTQEEAYQRVWTNSIRHGKEAKFSVDKVADKNTYQRIKNGKGVVIFEPLAVKSFLMAICDQLQGNRRFHVSKVDIQPFYVCFGFRPDISELFLQQVNKRIQWMTETDVIGKLHADSIWKFWQCEEMKGNEETSFKLKNLAATFYLLLISQAVSGAYLLYEIVVAYCQRSMK